MSEFYTDFQTPEYIAELMASYIDMGSTILEPTKGLGNLVRAADMRGTVIAPDLFEDIASGSRFDWIIMNPPFTPMQRGYEILFSCMEMSDNIIALMPWLTIINSSKRASKFKEFGLKSVTHLPRNVFPKSRVQTCLIELRKGFAGDTKLSIY